jgi:hypothetical protein
VPFAFHDAAWYSERVSVNFPAELPVNFAQIHQGRRQRILILADHSVFLNSMMLQDNNDNARFAAQTVRWLTEDGKRRRVLFLVDGLPERRFMVSPAEIPDPTRPPPRMPLPSAAALNQLLASWQQDDIFNRLIQERFSSSRMLSGFALGLTLMLLGYGFLRLWQGSYSTDTHP